MLKVWSSRMIYLGLLSLCFAPVSLAETTLENGQNAPAFTLNNLQGEAVSLKDFLGKTVVLEWFNPGCPFVVHAHEAGGALETLAKEASKDGIVWLAINSSAPEKQGHGHAVNQEAKTKWKMNHPVLLDDTGVVGKAYGAITTPHVYVIDKKGILVYQGAVDNAPFGRVDGERVPYLEQSLKDIKANKSVTTPKTKPYGCSVKY